MEIKDMFVKPIDRDLQGVIKVGDTKNENIRQELEEYVVTKELQKHFADFFAAYKKSILGTTPKMGVWISGFFGSGKSHLLKILSYILENREVGGKRAIDYFIDDHKIEDSMVLADMKLAAETPADVVLFNIDSKSDSKSDSNGKGNKDAIVNVFLKVFNEMQGFCGAIPHLADLERKLSEDGRYEEFKQKFEEAVGHSWAESRNDFDFIQDTIVKVLADMNYMSEEAGRNWCEKASQSYHISIEEFADRVKTYIDHKGNNHHVVFLVDEVGQYIGDDRNLMLNLQTVTEDLGTACGGKAWVIVTSQQDIDSVVKVKGNDFSKIQGRFDTRLSLSSANVDAVIKKRILEKTDTAAQMLRLLYGQKETAIKNKIVFTDSVERKLYAGKDDFTEVYPFIPYQFNLLGSVLTAIRTHGASGKHLSEGERSMLAMFKESAAAYMHKSEGTLIPFYAFYEPMENFLDHSHRGVISKAYENDHINPEHKTGDVFAVNVLKTLFLIKYVQDITSNLENITTLMISSIDDDRITLKNKVEEALKVLMGQMLVQKNGESYVFLTNEEQEINREIENEEVDNADVIRKVSELIFEDIYKDKKYRYPEFNGRYTFNFNQCVDDCPYKSNQSYDISVHVLTPASETTSELEKSIMSGQKHEVLIALPNDRAFMDEIQTHLKIEKFLRRSASSTMMQYESIKEAKSRELRDRYTNARQQLTENLKNAEIYVNGSKPDIKSRDVTSRINEALHLLVDAVYNKLRYIDTPLGEDAIRKLFEENSQFSLDLDNTPEANSLALQDVCDYISSNSRESMKTSMKTVKDRFMKAPYGFVEEDVDYLIARLFKRGDISFTVNGASVSLLNKSKDDIINYITKKQFAEKLKMSRKVRISDRDKKLCRDVMKEVFHTASTNNDEDTIMQDFIAEAGKAVEKLKEDARHYENTALYPGKETVQTGLKLFSSVISVRSAEDFYKQVSSLQDEFSNFAEDYERVRNFFGGEQRKIFDETLRSMKNYDDSKAYIENEELEKIVEKTKQILCEKEPYRDIPKLPELLEQFKQIYNSSLEEHREQVRNTIRNSYNRVMDTLETKAYAGEKKASYKSQFQELIDGAEQSGNITVLRSFADRADALKIRLLKDMDAEDLRAAQKKDGTKTTGHDKTPTVVKTYKKEKRLSFKTVMETSVWRLESEKDVDKYVEALRSKLTKELNDGSVVTVEF